ncbi:MAG: insulinase family protein [Acidobacteria bacterium]|nr:insulinase family protein [Acidobacteriota bacterium]
MKMNYLSRFALILFLLSASSLVFAQNGNLVDFSAQTALVSEFDVNGLKVILKRRPGSATVAGGLFIRGGARNITDKNAGIEQLMLSTAIEAGKTVPRQALRRELASKGSSIGAAVSNDYSAISFGTTKPDFPRIFDLLAKVVLDPAFAEDDLKRNREQILTGLRESGSVPEAALATLQERVIYAGHPYANDVTGTPATIGALTADDLRAYHKKIMETQRLLFVFVGDLDPEQLKAKITETFGKLPRGNYVDQPYPALDFSKGSLDATQRSLPTNYLKGVFAAPSPDNADYYAMRVAMAVLQTLVYQEVRGRLQLSYAPDAEIDSLSANTANISVSTTDPNHATTAMLNQMKFLKERTLNQEVIEEISSFFLTRHYMGQETSGAQVGELAKYELIGGGWRKSYEFLNGVKAVTGSDVQKVANKYMKNIRFAYIGNTAVLDRKIFVP